MTRRSKVLLTVAGGLVLLAGGLLVVLARSDFSGWRDTAARIAGNALGREMRIGGDFAVDLGRITRIRATDVRLANAEWASEPVMASVERLDAELDLWSLVRGPLRLRSVTVEGGKAVFETAPDGHSNWALGGGGVRNRHDRPFGLRIDRIRTTAVELRFNRRTGSPPLDLEVVTLVSDGDATGMHQLELTGQWLDRAFTVSGRLGPLTGIVNASRVEHDLAATLADVELVSRGTVADLAELRGVDLDAAATIPDLDVVTELLGLGATGFGRLRLEVTAASDGALTSFTATATADTATARAVGTLDSLAAPGDLDVKIEASGPDVRSLAALAGISPPAADPFEISGRVRWRGFPVEVSDLEARAGDNRLTADGSLGAPPAMLGTDFQLHGSGPNLAALGALVGLELPSDRFEVDGRVQRRENGVELSAIEVGVGRSRLSVAGFVGDPPEYGGTDLAVSASGPDLRQLSSLAGVELPEGAFEVSGRFGDGGDAIALDGVRAHAAGLSAAVDGRLTTVPGLDGTELELVVDGDDLAVIGPSVGVAGLPQGPFHVEGSIAFEAAAARLRNVEARFANLEVRAEAVVSRSRGLVGSTARGEAAGPRLSVLAPLIGGRPLPEKPFRVVGALEILEHGLGLNGVELELGTASGRVDGTLGRPPGFSGTAVSAEVAGPSLADVGDPYPGVSLPDVPFQLAIEAAVVDGEIRVSSSSLSIDDNLASATGTVSLEDGLVGSHGELTVRGPELGAAARLLAASVGAEWPELPGLEYTLSGVVALDDTGYRVEPLTGTLGRARAEITGRIGQWPDLAGSALDLDIGGPDASILRAVAGMDLPVAPFRVVGRLSTTGDGYGFEGFRLSLGDLRLELDGTAGSPPSLIGTDLDLTLDGPDLSILGNLAGVRDLPALPVHLSGRFEGDPHEFTATRVRARLGSSDLEGSFRVDLRDRPAATCTLRSTAIDVAELWSARPLAGDRPTPETTGRRLLIPDEPLDLSALEAFDLELDWTVGTLRTRLNRFNDVGVGLTIADGQLEVDRFEGSGSSGGTLTGAATLAPDPAGYRLATHLLLDDGKVNLAGPGADPSRFTPVNVELDLRATGRTPHRLAASSDGTVTVVAKHGVLARSVVDLVAADILVTLLDTLNPFTKSEGNAELECAVIMARVEDGVVKLDPLAIQTDRVTVVGGGTVDLDTEKIRLDWVTKPRKGLGISASAITNSYIRVGGTLAEPNLEAKPVEALATTGVAVATAGISILAKGLLDRVTAEKKVCETALREIEAERREPE
ncbi:MAG TPA: AsmA family protein [Candidatus Sulfomarinibacteraceae bacterium]|nr:AsmA family protein [Candidatus Sulfomarinibacteraceae bacterium]